MLLDPQFIIRIAIGGYNFVVVECGVDLVRQVVSTVNVREQS